MDEEKETPERIEQNDRSTTLYHAQDWAKGRGDVTPESLVSAAKMFYKYIKTGE